MTKEPEHFPDPENSHSLVKKQFLLSIFAVPVLEPRLRTTSVARSGIQRPRHGNAFPLLLKRS